MHTHALPAAPSPHRPAPISASAGPSPHRPAPHLGHHSALSPLPSPHQQRHDCQLRRYLLPDYSSASTAASGTFRKLPGFQDSCLAPAFYAEKCVCLSLETGDYHGAGRRSSTQTCPFSLGPFLQDISRRTSIISEVISPE